MKTRIIFPLLAALLLFSVTGCEKDTLDENRKTIKKLWKLDAYRVNGVDRTANLQISDYNESYTDNAKYDRSYTANNGTKITQNGSFEFETATRLKISGVGSIQFTNEGTVSSSYYDILRLSDTQFWYSFTNGSATHEFRLSRK